MHTTTVLVSRVKECLPGLIKSGNFEQCLKSKAICEDRQTCFAHGNEFIASCNPIPSRAFPDRCFTP